MLSAYRAVDGRNARLLLDFGGRPGNYGAVDYHELGIIQRDVAGRRRDEIGGIWEAEMKDLDAVEGAVLEVPSRSLVCPAQYLQQWPSDLSEADN
jgi:hypothetical protein